VTTLKLGFGVTQGHRKWHHSIEHIRLYIHSNYASISYRFRDVAAYWSKIATPLYLAHLLGVKSSDLRNDPWCRKTRMIGLSDGERISMICSAVLIQYTRVTDGQTDGIGVAYTRYSIYAGARKNCLPLAYAHALNHACRMGYYTLSTRC